jgi:formylglycine-generating enzyme required for sulfatase activity
MAGIRSVTALVALAWGVVGCAAGTVPGAGDSAAPPPDDRPSGWNGEAFTQQIPGTTVGLDMVPIPAGRMELDGADGTQVEVGPFWMSRIEVPWDVFDVWVFALDQGIQVATGKGEEAVSRPSRPYVRPGGNFGHQGMPALGMTFASATVFAAWMSEVTGHNYRLPTEAEWIYACRANDGEPDDLGTRAWYWENSNDRTHPGAQKTPNAFGLADMLGNAGEWASRTSEDGVLMGGSFTDAAEAVSCEARKQQTPAWNATDPQLPKSIWWLTDAPFVGLRLVREP